MNHLSVIEKDDTFDKIQAYYMQNAELSEKEMEICARWERAFALLCEQKDKRTAVTMYMATLKAQGSEISQAQAYRDFAAAERIFTPIRQYSKEFLRLIVVESCRAVIASCDEKLAENKDMSTKEWERIEHIRGKAEERLIKAAGLDQADPNLPDFSKLTPHDYKISMPEEYENMLLAAARRGPVDVTAIFQSIASEAKIVNDESEGKD